jgi:hypothetical protein
MRPGGNTPPNFHQVDIPSGVTQSHQLQGYGAEGRIQVKLADLIALIQGGGVDLSSITFVTVNDETGDLPASLHFGDTATVTWNVVGTEVQATAIVDAGDVNATDVLFTQNQVVLGRNTSGAGAGEELSISTVLNWLSTAQGAVIYRGAANWTVLAPGTSGQFLKTLGAGANPAWADALTTAQVVGKQTTYIPASAMTPATTNGPLPSQTESATNKVNFPTLAFDATTAESAWFSISFPKSWDKGTVTFQADWTTSATDTDGIALSLAGVSVADGGSFDVAVGTPVVVTDDAQSSATKLYVTAESAAVTIAGTPANDELVHFRVQRVVSDGNDDMAEDLLLVGIRVFYTTNALNDA